MKYSIHFFDEVKFDIQEAKEWYKNQKLGLEKRFAREVKKSILRVQKNPKAYELKYKNVRSAFTNVFPYSIHFLIDDALNQIVIVAILHQSRNPNIQRDRK